MSDLAEQPVSPDPGSLSDLLDIAAYDDADIDAAVAWWDAHASDGWSGSLEE